MELYHPAEEATSQAVKVVQVILRRPLRLKGLVGRNKITLGNREQEIEPLVRCLLEGSKLVVSG